MNSIMATYVQISTITSIISFFEMGRISLNSMTAQITSLIAIDGLTKNSGVRKINCKEQNVHKSILNYP